VCLVERRRPSSVHSHFAEKPFVQISNVKTVWWRPKLLFSSNYIGGGWVFSRVHGNWTNRRKLRLLGHFLNGVTLESSPLCSVISIHIYIYIYVCVYIIVYTKGWNVLKRHLLNVYVSDTLCVYVLFAVIVCLFGVVYLFIIIFFL